MIFFPLTQCYGLVIALLRYLLIDWDCLSGERCGPWSVSVGKATFYFVKIRLTLPLS